MFKVSQNHDKKIKNFLTWLGIVIFIFLGVRYLISNQRDLVLDALSSIIVVGIFSKFYEHLHQDYKSYFCVVFVFVLHDLFLYDTAPFGIRFEHYIHLLGGFTIAMVTDRVFNEKIGRAKRFLLLVIFALGIGVIGEIIEWLGYHALGSGEGFFKYGIGDEGGWSNSIFDLIFDGIGSVPMAILTLFRKA